ncbi:hypothetical protein DL93DRAFT_902488 [Clavulina sp. PMI_390]|nr:hypothetical protein DL93DRAFT_902488 [Clavulina sp. PMI_390]
MDDKTWVDAARACIRGRSEALWERFKGALGVPAELEVEPEDEEDLEEVAVILPDLHDVGAGPAGMSGYAASTGTAGGGPATTYAESEGGGMGRALSEAANLSSSVGDLASLGYFPPPAHVQEKEREAYLEPVFADQSDSSDESVEDEDEIQDEELVNRAAAKDAAAGEPSMGRHFSNLSSGALSDGGWSGRVMENIGEDEEDEPEVVDDPKAAAAPVSSRPESIRSPTVEFEDYGLGLGALGSGAGGAQREIRALTITTSTAPVPSITPHAPASSSPAIGVGLNLGVDSGAGGVVVSPLALSAGGLPDPSATTVPTTSEESVASTAGPPATTTVPISEPPADQTPTPPTPQSPPSAGSNPRVVLRRPSESIARTLSATSSAGAGVSAGGATSPGLPSSAGSGGGVSGYRGFGGYGLAPANRPYHPALSERGPGNPLFPSSFAGLSVGPTLVANVPKISRSSGSSFFFGFTFPMYSSLYPAPPLSLGASFLP